MIPLEEVPPSFLISPLTDLCYAVFFLDNFSVQSFFVFCSFAFGAWDVFLGAGILAHSPPSTPFVLKHHLQKNQPCSPLPHSFYPSLESRMCFSKQYVRGLSSGCLCTMQMKQCLSRKVTAYIGTNEIDYIKNTDMLSDRAVLPECWKK